MLDPAWIQCFCGNGSVADGKSWEPARDEDMCSGSAGREEPQWVKDKCGRGLVYRAGPSQWRQGAQRNKSIDRLRCRNGGGEKDSGREVNRISMRDKGIGQMGSWKEGDMF